MAQKINLTINKPVTTLNGITIDSGVVASVILKDIASTDQGTVIIGETEYYASQSALDNNKSSIHLEGIHEKAVGKRPVQELPFSILASDIASFDVELVDVSEAGDGSVKDVHLKSAAATETATIMKGLISDKLEGVSSSDIS